MSIYFLSPDPKRLLDSFTDAIGNSSSHRITTWRMIQNPKGEFYTHTSDQWKDRAWLKPDDTENGRLAFYVKRFNGIILFNQEVFTYYQDHLEETFSRHFSGQFSEVHATLNPAGEDDSF
jgi:hypothetical protein